MNGHIHKGSIWLVCSQITLATVYSVHVQTDRTLDGRYTDASRWFRPNV